MVKPTASFNGLDFASSVPGLRIVSTDPYSLPNRVLSTAALANVDKSVTSNSNYKDKKLTIEVEIGRDSRDLLEASLDKLYGILQGEEGTLSLPYAGGTRVWTATLESVTPSGAIQGGLGTFSVAFECADPIGRDPNSTAIFSETVTGNSSTISFVLDGTAKQQPIFTLVLTALTGGTSKNIVITNPATGQSATITNTYAPGDVLVIDSTTKSAKLNGTEVRVTGAIPEWDPGAGSVQYSDTLTTRTRTFSGIYYRRMV